MDRVLCILTDTIKTNIDKSISLDHFEKLASIFQDFEIEQKELHPAESVIACKAALEQVIDLQRKRRHLN